MSEYKPNSYKSKAMAKEKLPEKKVEKVIKGNANIKKRSELSKVKDMFISEDARNVKSYVILDVLIPAIKKAVSDIVTNGIDMILYGETGHSKKSSPVGGISYRNYYDRKDDDYRYGGSRARTGYSQDDIIVDSRGEADEILERMDELIATYGVVSVADLYDLAGITCAYTDNKYGWTSIRNAEVRRVRDRYVIKMPKAMPID